jgi:hypothetical protein
MTSPLTPTNSAKLEFNNPKDLYYEGGFSGGAAVMERDNHSPLEPLLTPTPAFSFSFAKKREAKTRDRPINPAQS